MVNQLKIVFGLVLLSSGLVAGQVPKYRFEPGQELTYRIDWTIRYSAADRSALHDDYTDVVARVARKNPDGSFRIVLSVRETITKTADRAQTLTGPLNSAFCLDVFPDGRELPVRNHAVGATTGMVFPPLPRNQEELKGGWTAKLQDFTYACKAEPEKSDFQFRATVTAPVMLRLHDSRTTRFSFDPARGFVTSSDDTFVRASNSNGAGSGSTKLVALKVIGESDLKQLAKDVDAYVDALDAYNARMKRAGDLDLDRAREIARDAQTEFKGAVEKVVDPDFKAEGDAVLADHNARLGDVVATISRRAAQH